MRTFLLLGVFLLASLATVLPARAQTDWEALLAQMAETNPELAAQWEQAKKDAEKNEKNLKQAADKHFQSSFDTVFGKDNFKPSSGLEMLKVIEAISAGDIDFAGEAGANALIASYMPGLGQYIAVMKTVAGGIKAAEQVWINGLNDTKAYHNFITILYDQPTRENAYIPSYMITYLRNNAQFGPQISAIYDDMRAREDTMFRQWVSDDAAMTQMLLPGWASRWISARGKVPTEREMFNYFLYNAVKNAKSTYMERLYDEYIEPLLRQEARAQRRNMAAIMGQALAQISTEMQAGTDNQCPALLAAYKQGTAAVKQQQGSTIMFYKQVQDTWKAKYNAALDQEAAVQARRWAPLLAEEKSFEAERDALSSRRKELEAVYARMEIMADEIRTIQASFDPEAKDEKNAAIARRGNAKIAVHNQLRDSEFKPLKQDYNEMAAAYDERIAAYKAKEKTLQETPLDKSRSTGLFRGTKQTRDAIQIYAKDGSKCALVSQAMAQDNVAGQLGLDPSAAIANCTAMMEALNKTNAVAQQMRDLKCD